ncbi:MAG: uroporphyrinogen-III C-methyltransferase [Methylococcaceae bacterium]|nr:uroporphyrinogen-III C-methyltransferase [Methylococcaceae bacterium]
MAELNEQPEPELAEISRTIDSPKPVRRSKSGLLFAVIILLLIVGLAGAGFYFFSQLRDKQEGLGGEVKSELSRQINDYQGQLTAIQKQISALQSEISGKEEHFNKTLETFSDLHGQKLDATRKELSDKVLQVQRQLGKTRGDWLIADAEYLLSIANERLHLVGDVNTTKEALEAADQRLRESGDTGTIKIREQIAKEIAQIKDIKEPDIVGIYSALQTLAGETAKLSLLLPYTGKPLTKPEEAEKSSAISEDNNELLNTAIEELEGIVTIKRSDQPIKEILSEEQAEFIREQLRVKLELVKIALVQENDALYQTGLADIKSWIEKHFNKNGVTESFQAELTRLQGINLRTQFPDISLSLKMLRDVTKLRIETDKALQTPEESASELKDTQKSETDALKQPAEPSNSSDSIQAPQAPDQKQPE